MGQEWVGARQHIGGSGAAKKPCGGAPPPPTTYHLGTTYHWLLATNY